MSIGQVFHTKVERNKLLMEAWLDTERAGKSDESRKVLERVRSGTLVEVSVGAFVETEKRSGEKNGKHYKGIWRNIIPDHLAMLPEGTSGACDIGMGCGAPRAASRGGSIVKTRAQRIKALLTHLKVQGNGVISALTTTEEETLTVLEAAVKEDGLLSDSTKPWYRRLLSAFIGAQDGMSDKDLRDAIDQVLRSEQGYLGIEAVYPEEAQVIYAVATGEDIMFFRRGYKLNSEGEASLQGKTEEVQPVTRFEPVAASGSSTTVPTPAKKKEETAMAATKKDRLAAIVASGKTCFREGDLTHMETFSDDRVAELEKHVETVTAAEKATAEKVAADKAAADKVAADKAAADEKSGQQKAASKKSPEDEEKEFLDTHPAIGEIVTEHKTAQANKKAGLVASLKDAAKAGYTEKELETMSVAELEKLASVIIKPVIDFSGTGVPRAASAGDEIEAPPSMTARVVEMRKRTA